jgi:hypothetical protein
VGPVVVGYDDKSKESLTEKQTRQAGYLYCQRHFPKGFPSPTLDQVAKQVALEFLIGLVAGIDLLTEENIVLYTNGEQDLLSKEHIQEGIRVYNENCDHTFQNHRKIGLFQELPRNVIF